MSTSRGLGVEMRGGLIQQQQGGIAYQSPGDRDPLALTGRQLRASLSDRGVDAFGKRGDSGGETGLIGSAGNRLLTRVGSPSRMLSARCRRKGERSAAPRPSGGEARPGARGPAPGDRRRRCVRRRCGGTKPSRSGRSVLLPAPLGPTSATCSPGRCTHTRRRAQAGRAGDTARSPNRSARVGSTGRSGSGRCCQPCPGSRRALQLLVEHVEDISSGGHSFSRGVVLRTDCSQRQVRLGSEQQDEQARTRSRGVPPAGEGPPPRQRERWKGSQ